MSTQQFQIDFERRLPVSAQIGMAQCDANADDRWKREVDAAIRQVALTHSTFTADEVVAELERNDFHFTTHNGSYGPVLALSRVVFGAIGCVEKSHCQSTKQDAGSGSRGRAGGVEVRMSAKKKVSGNIITMGYEAKSFSMCIKNENGVHDHTRNGEHFVGKQKDCPLCNNGSAIEKAIGGIGL